MTKRNKIIIIAGLIVVLLIVGGFFIYSFTRDDGEDEPVAYTPEGEVSQEIEDPEVVDSGSTNPEDASNSDQTSTVDNSDLSATLQPTKDMESVINQNKGNLNNEEVINNVAPSYPRNLIPLYKAAEVADSNDITTDNGNPGWTCQYGSDGYVDDIVGFYKNLLSSTSGYSDETNADTTQIVGTVDNCYVQVTVSPNNPDRTGMNTQSDVDIFIERKS